MMQDSTITSYTISSDENKSRNRSLPFCVDMRRVRFRLPELPRALAGQIWTDPVPLHDVLLLFLLLHSFLHLVLIFQLVVSAQQRHLVYIVRAD